MRNAGISRPAPGERQHIPLSRSRARTGAKPRWYASVAVATDATGVLVPVLAVQLATGRPGPLLTATVATAGWLGVRAAHRRYTRRSLGESRGLLAAVHDWAILIGCLAVLRVLTGESSPVLTSVAALLPALVITSLVGALLHAHLTGQRRRAHAVRRVLLVGEPPAADAVAAQLAARTDHPYVVIGAVPVGDATLSCGVPETARLSAEASVAGSQDGALVLDAARRLDADQILAVPGAHLTGERLRRMSWAVHDAGLPLTVATGLSDVALRRVEVESAAGLSLLHVAPPTRRGAPVVLKAVLDRVGAAALLVLLAPLLTLIAVLVRLDSRGPALYRQRRVGHHGAHFTIWKFRTMVEGADRLREELEDANEAHGGPLFKLRQDPRITRTGRVLRRFSLDELPQLVNVLNGTMSLVGPRPPLPEEVAQYTAAEGRRLLVKPGMTGPWQVSGRSDLSWDESVALDVSYADNWSITQDLDVLGRTARAVVNGRGAY
ncbi:exopolysaccharide biosynthesis polyprenyl glycosylphosphotransferase [Streptomyces otsuchiensis]|uniref:exopolysaccharide biosynthesis polyprenyl glycosylphosphotransferase n=1 Tax=Streptomyces otsuchiensis TaxID=2681388 RepID=UPI00103215E7|nr:exopolysaccharide biosynthesis polyprenyl glycosylphosphotransferase [Streptomyces otsuchiensis]